MNLDIVSTWRAVLALPALLACVLAAAACDETFIAIDSSGFIELRFGDVRWEGEVITMNNAGADTVFHFLVESEAATVLEWAPCFDADPLRCPQLAPGDTAELTFSDIAGFESGDTLAYFNWWTRTERSVKSEPIALR